MPYDPDVIREHFNQLGAAEWRRREADLEGQASFEIHLDFLPRT